MMTQAFKIEFALTLAVQLGVIFALILMLRRDRRPPEKPLLPLAGEGGAKRRMRARVIGHHLRSFTLSVFELASLALFVLMIQLAARAWA